MVEVERFINSRFNSNTYVIAHSEHDDVWIVDPGDANNVFEWMKVHSKTSIMGVLLTHAHFDHLYGINEILFQYPRCVVYIANNYGREALHNPKINGSKYTDEGPIVINDNAQVEYYKNKMLLWEDVEMQTINTPGHSDDSQCLIVDGMMFTGDTLIKDVRTVTKLKGGSVEKLDDTVVLLKQLKGLGLKVMPGHGEEFELDGYDYSKITEGRISNN